MRPFSSNYSTRPEVTEEELRFAPLVHIELEAYLAEGFLLLSIAFDTKAFIPCSICNEMTEISMQLTDEYHHEPLEASTSNIFDASAVIRELILLQVPAFTECKGGSCPERGRIKNYLKKSDPDKTYHPFAEL